MAPSPAATVSKPEIVEAELFLQPLASGRNKPALVTARGNNGPVDCVIKMAQGLETPFLAPLPYLCEWLAAALAPFLGVWVPRPYEVLVTEAFARSIDDPRFKAIALGSIGSTYGSEFVGMPFTQLPKGAAMEALCPAAEALLVFDAYIHNPDRRIENANVLASANDLLAFDHGDAFSFSLAIGGLDPAIDPLLTTLESHVFSRWLRGRPCSLLRFLTHLATLTDEVLEAIVAATPNPWQDGYAAGKLAKIIDVLRRRRD